MAIFLSILQNKEKLNHQRKLSHTQPINKHNSIFTIKRLIRGKSYKAKEENVRTTKPFMKGQVSSTLEIIFSLL